MSSVSFNGEKYASNKGSAKKVPTVLSVVLRVKSPGQLSWQALPLSTAREHFINELNVLQPLTWKVFIMQFEETRDTFLTRVHAAAQRC